MKIVDYIILRRQTKTELEEKVCLMIKDGWQPYGYPLYPTANNWIQSMVKYSNPQQHDTPTAQG